MQSWLARGLTRRVPLGVLGSLVAYGVLTCQFSAAQGQTSGGMFRNRSELIPFNTVQLNYGVAVSDVDGDGDMEWIVAGFNGPNIILKLDRATGRYINLTDVDDRFKPLTDPGGAAIGVCACDIDGDGREEIYFLNTNDRYSGPKLYKDKLFKWRRGADGVERYEDLFADDGNDAALSMFAGRSVAAIDRKGTGKYSVILATYGQFGQGQFGLIEMDEALSDVATGRIVLKNVAQEAGIAVSTGGRGITVGPIVGTNGHSDIFFDNEGGSRQNPPENKLFVNDGNGRFTDLAASVGLADPSPGRGVALADFNNDGLIDIVYGNWMNPHKLMIQQADGQFVDRASAQMAQASPIRTVIAADFDNDGDLEVFYNNIVYDSRWGGSDPESWKNHLFRVTSSAADVSVTQLDVGDALEPEGYGTGGAVADMDGDGQLELLLSHGESRQQPLSLYDVRQGGGHHWLRVMPLTANHAPARGAKVTVRLSDGRALGRVVDGGSGYLCQMEPVAHFGLGDQTAQSLRIQWPDGRILEVDLSAGDQNRLHRIPYPSAAGGDTRYQVGGSQSQARATGGSQGVSSGSNAGQAVSPGHRGTYTRDRGGHSGRGSYANRGSDTHSRGSGDTTGTSNRDPYRSTSSRGSGTTNGRTSSASNTRSYPRTSNRGTDSTINRATDGRGTYANNRATDGRRRYTDNNRATPLAGTNNRGTNPGADNTDSGTCSTARVSNYVRDDVTGCYSARPMRMGQCQGTCTARGRCCQPRAERFRNVLFACRNGGRYRKRAKVGVRRCRCARCQA